MRNCGFILVVVIAAAAFAAAAEGPKYAHTVYGAPTAALVYPFVLGSPVVGFERYLSGVVSLGIGFGYSPEGVEGMFDDNYQWHNVCTAAVGVKIFPSGRGRGFLLSPEAQVRYSPEVDDYDVGYHKESAETNFSPVFLAGWRWLVFRERLGLTLAGGAGFNGVGVMPIIPRLDFFAGVHF